MFLQTQLTNHHLCDWVFMVGRSKADASAGKLLVGSVCKQVFLFFIADFCRHIYLPPHLIIDYSNKTAFASLCYGPHNCTFGYLQ